MGLEEFAKTLANLGVTSKEASEAFNNFSTHIPQFTQDDIQRIKMNPSLSAIAKIRIIRNMKKQMKGGHHGLESSC